MRQPSIELPSMAVASTKSRWETGEVQAQSTTKAPSCKVGLIPGRGLPLGKASVRPSRLTCGEHWDVCGVAATGLAPEWKVMRDNGLAQGRWTGPSSPRPQSGKEREFSVV